MRWELRQATAQDEDRLYEIHRAAKRDHVEAVWGWDETNQRSRFRTGFDPARRLYERLGFHIVGETTTHVEMVHE